jgi:hypothetical protein
VTPQQRDKRTEHNRLESPDREVRTADGLPQLDEVRGRRKIEYRR